MTQPAPADSLDLQNLVTHYSSAQWTPLSVVEEVLRRIDAYGDSAVWISLLPKSDVMAAASVAAQRLAEGESRPLLGVPFAVKDNIDVAGQFTTAACPDFAYRAARTSTVVAKLLDAGAILIGKTNMDQFATGLVGTRSPYGTPRNPFDERYIPGGSSSGSAVAVSAGLVSFALGTDTAGSGRVPAAFNSIVGLKPTRGRISTSGIVPACRSLDCVSIFALNCFDAAEVLKVAAGHDPADSYSRRRSEISQRPARFPLEFRFGIPDSAHLNFFQNAQTEKIFRDSLHRLRELGGKIVEIDFSPFAQAGALLYQGPWLAERITAVKPILDQRPHAMLPVIREILSDADRFDAISAFAGIHELQDLYRRTEDKWEEIDVLLVPTTGTIYTREQIESEPRKFNTNLGYYTNFANLLDLAAVALPAGFGSDGLPVGITLLAPAGSEAALLSLGDTLHHRAAITMGATGAALPHPRPISAETGEFVRLAVVGAHLSRQPLNHQLVNLEAQLIRTCSTAPCYALFALAGTKPPKPGLVRCADGRGGPIEVEIWEMTTHAFGEFVAAIPPPLGIGTLQLDDGESVKGFLCESVATQGATDITRFGGWRAFLQSRST